MRTIDAARCTLEPQVRAHAREMFAVLADPAIYEFENEPPESESWLEDRYSRLESRTSPDGAEIWLNWVIRLPDGELAGYVQATVSASGAALVGYELASRHWRRGIGSAAVVAMMEELRCRYGVRSFVAVLKAGNYRSLGLLASLGFQLSGVEQASGVRAGPDEVTMSRPAFPAQRIRTVR